MRYLTTALGLLALWLIVPALFAQPKPCSGDEYRQFDFWIGEWKVTQPDGSVAGENLIESTLGGCVVTEHWKGTSGSEGKSFNMYFARDGKWHQTWVDNAGARLDLSGGLDEKGRMVLSGTLPTADGKATRHEISWTPKPDGTVVQHWRASQDGGESWNDLFLGTYTRKP